MTKKQANSGMLHAIFKMKHAQPFKPFELTTADGDRFEIAKRDSIARSPSGRVISFYAWGEPADRTLSIDEIVSVHPARGNLSPSWRSKR